MTTDELVIVASLGMLTLLSVWGIMCVKRLAAELRDRDQKIKSELENFNLRIRELVKQIDIAAPKKFDWERWMPFKAQRPSISAYLEFTSVEKEKSKDTTEKRVRNFFMAGLLEQLAKRGLQGADVVECGCYLGHTAFMIARALQANQFDGKFLIFDSFEGLSNIRAEDLEPIGGGEPASEIVRQLSPKGGVRRFAGGLERVKKNLSQFNFIEYYKGWIPERFPEVSERRFAFVNIDVDLYQPTFDSLEFFFPRLIDGGVIFVDDYGFESWPGSIRAVEEFLEKHTPLLTFDVPGGGFVIIK